MANRKTQKKREREAAKKLEKRQSYFDYAFSPVNLVVTSKEIKMEGDEVSNGAGSAQYRVPGRTSIPSGEYPGEL